MLKKKPQMTTSILPGCRENTRNFFTFGNGNIEKIEKKTRHSISKSPIRRGGGDSND